MDPIKSDAVDENSPGPSLKEKLPKEEFIEESLNGEPSSLENSSSDENDSEEDTASGDSTSDEKTVSGGSATDEETASDEEPSFYKGSSEDDIYEPPLKKRTLPSQKDSPHGHYMVHSFNNTVLIEMVENCYSPETFWSKLRLDSVWTVVHKRLVSDPHRPSRKRALVVFISSDIAREAANRYHRSEDYPDICAFIVSDLVKETIKLERALMRLNYKQEQNVIISEINQEWPSIAIKGCINSYFSSVGKIIAIDEGFSRGEMIVRFNTLSEAWAAELAFDSKLVAGARIRVALSSNILQAQWNLIHGLMKFSAKSSNSILWDRFKAKDFSRGCSNTSCVNCYA